MVRKREEGGHVEVKHERTNLGVDMVVLGVDTVNLRRRSSEGGERARGRVSRVRRLGGG